MSKKLQEINENLKDFYNILGTVEKILERLVLIVCTISTIWALLKTF